MLFNMGMSEQMTKYTSKYLLVLCSRSFSSFPSLGLISFALGIIVSKHGTPGTHCQKFPLTNKN